MTIFPPDPNLNALRLEFARLRAGHGWTYGELAGRTGLSHRTVIDLEHGRTTGTITTWHTIAHAFGVPLDQLLGALCSGHTPPGTPHP
ncbi:helix-turn-helix domain-containing protein [Streptomyces sp. NPDC102384]|uniref:helix-turn-helix domain-containing protein n=1 Tax=Streptomyces sp. NPDC102384 TaxID=3366166 RepID=UPI00380A726D